MSDIVKQIKIAFEEQSVRAEIKKLQDVLNRADVIIPIKLAFNVGGKIVTLDQLGGTLSGAFAKTSGSGTVTGNDSMSSVQRAQEDTRQALNRMSFGQYAGTTSGIVGMSTANSADIFSQLTRAYEKASGKFDAGSPQSLALKRWEEEIKDLTGTFSKLNRLSEDLADQFDKLDDVAKRKAQDDLALLEKQKQDTVNRAREATIALSGGGGSGAVGTLLRALTGAAAIGTVGIGAQAFLDFPVIQARSQGILARGRAQDYLAATRYDLTAEAVDLNPEARARAEAGRTAAAFKSDRGAVMSYGAIGAGIGAGIGSIVPLIGTALGGAVGFGLGGLGGLIYNRLSGASVHAGETGFRSSLEDERNKVALQQAKYEHALTAGRRNYAVGSRAGMTEGEMATIRRNLMGIDNESSLLSEDWDRFIVANARAGRSASGYSDQIGAAARYYNLYRGTGIDPGTLVEYGSRLARRSGSLSVSAPGADLTMRELGSDRGTGFKRLDDMLKYGAGTGYGGNPELLSSYAEITTAMMEAAGGGYGAIGGTEAARAIRATTENFGAGQVALGAGARLLNSMNATQTQTGGAAGVANATAVMRAMSQFAPGVGGLERVQLMNRLMVRGPSALSDPEMQAQLRRMGVTDVSKLQSFLRQEKVMELLRLNPLLSERDLSSVRSGQLTGAASDALMDIAGSDNVQAAESVRDWAFGADATSGEVARKIREQMERKTDASANPSRAVDSENERRALTPTQEARSLLDEMGKKALNLRSMVDVLDRINNILPTFTDNTEKVIVTMNSLAR